MDSAHTSEIVNVRVQNIFHVPNNIMCRTDCKNITAPTLCAVETFCFRYVIVNTLHKADNKYNNNNNIVIKINFIIHLMH